MKIGLRISTAPAGIGLCTSVNRPRGFGRAALLGGAVAGFLLLMPMPMQPGGRTWPAMGGGAHVTLFAGLAWILGRRLPPAVRGWILWGGLALFAAAVEWLQPWMGRSAEMVDWLYGAGGAACICGSWRLHGHPRVRWGAVLALGLFPLVWEVAMWRAEIRAFPVLAAPGTCWANRRWTLNSVRVSASPNKLFRVARDVAKGPATSASYPGLFRSPVRPDWSRMQALQSSVFWPGPGPAVFAIRMDDQPGNPPYPERFQQEFTATQGWNFVQLSAAQIARTSGGRAMRLDSIRQWGVFLVSDVPLDYFLLDTVRLTLQAETP